ncbi:tetratricopeptide repeat-containing sensor histidine kinase [Thalassobellus citreus]|uniref:tetratricopeptide repeat-containing sensor histidine kinase n=1 Tax=Thalassobellus citreus TaxID=3367752 RepID=UPI0037AECE79
MNIKFYFLLFFCSYISFSQEVNKREDIDSIQYYLTNSENVEFVTIEKRLHDAKRAKVLSERIKIDSLIVKSYASLSSIYSKKGDSKTFYYSHIGLKLANKIKDSIALANINKNLGYYYYGKEVDSAYYYDDRAEKLFNALDDYYNRAIVLLDIALIQKQEKDLTGSELTSIKGLSLLDQLEETKDVLKFQSHFYNNLGHIFKILEQFDEAIPYFKKAIDKQNEIDGANELMLNNLKNNLAVTYKDAGKYNHALYYLKEILGNKGVEKERPDFFAVVLDNYAHASYLSNNYEKLPNLYLKALKICDSIGAESYTVIINQHLAQYYKDLNKTDSARYYAYKSKEISKKYSKDDLLRSYLLLSDIEDDSIAVKYYDKYIKLNDSLIKNERATRNKFTRIQYETNQIEQENKQITRERMWLLVISIILIIASILLYIVITQRNKNNELKFRQDQQEANEEIYNLMLSQNENIEEARTLEKQRISEELHDGVLGRLFGTRLSLDSLNMNKSDEAIKTRAQYIDELKTIEQDIRKVSHELNTDFVSGSGFIDIIKTLVETQTNVYKLEYTLKHDDAIIWEEVSNKTKIHIYRVVQESLHNIYKHANASIVNISFKLKSNVICLTMTDDGSGFNVNKAKTGIGLKNMNSRIQEIEGTISITSKQNIGTTVTIEAPID